MAAGAAAARCSSLLDRRYDGRQAAVSLDGCGRSDLWPRQISQQKL